MNNYINRLNINTNKLSIIHVAGTKGKESSCAYIEELLWRNFTKGKGSTCAYIESLLRYQGNIKFYLCLLYFIIL